MRVRSISIKGMNNTDSANYLFGNNVSYLNGPNGAGKSTVLEAIQLALLGYIPAYGKTKESIFKHCNGKSMNVVCTLYDEEGKSSDIIIDRTFTESAGSVKSSVNVIPSNTDLIALVGKMELPIFNFNEFVGMTANKLKDWFIDFLPKGNESIDWDAEITNCLEENNMNMSKDEKSKVISEIKSFNLNGMEEVRKANEIFKEKVSYSKEVSARLLKTLSTLVYYEDVSNSAMSEESICSEIDELETKIRGMEKARDDAEKNKRIVDEINKLEEEKKSLERYASGDDKKSLETSLSEIENSKEEIEKRLQDMLSKKSALLISVNEKSKVIQGDGVCPYTQKVCSSVKAMIEAMIQEKSVTMKKVEEINQNIVSCNAEITKIRLEIKEKENKISEIKKSEDNLNYIQTRIETLKSFLTNNPIEESLGDLNTSEIKEKVKGLQDTLVKIKSNKQYNALQDSITKGKFDSDRLLDCFKCLAKMTDANGLQSSMMKRTFIELDNKINKYVKVLFGDDVSSRFYISDRANSFSFGIERNSKYIPFDLLSSGEKCLYALSLMIVINEMSSSPLNIILADDIVDHLDDEKANMLFESISKVTSVQFIIAGVKECKLDEIVIPV